MPSCYYVMFRKTTGAEPDEVQGQIMGNFSNLVSSFDEDAFEPQDPTNYGVLETTQTDYETIEVNLIGTGTPGKHVDDPTGTPTLADGDPS